MKQTAPGVYWADRLLQGDVHSLAMEAASEKRLARLCLHESLDSPVQEMIVATPSGYRAQVHRHDEYETISVLQGLAKVIIYDDSGMEQDSVFLGEDCISFAIGHRWHKVIALTPVAVLHEVKHGPFRPMILRKDDA